MLLRASESRKIMYSDMYSYIWHVGCLVTLIGEKSISDYFQSVQSVWFKNLHPYVYRSVIYIQMFVKTYKIKHKEEKYMWTIYFIVEVCITTC